MQTRNMQTKFGQNIELSTHTWTFIMKEYLKALPESIEISRKEIAKKRDTNKKTWN